MKFAYHFEIGESGSPRCIAGDYLSKIILYTLWLDIAYLIHLALDFSLLSLVWPANDFPIGGMTRRGICTFQISSSVYPRASNVQIVGGLWSAIRPKEVAEAVVSQRY